MNDMLMMLCLMRMLMHIVIGLNACLTPRVLQSARGVPSRLPRRATDLTSPKASETRQKRARFDAVEHSDEVGETPASDSRRAAVSHLGRACVEAYRGEDECSGGFGAEDRSLVLPAVSGGALQRWRCGGAATAAALTSGGRIGERGWDRMEWPGGAGRRSDQVKAGRPRRVHDADVRPPRGRRRVDEGERPRAGERGRGNRAALSGWPEREAGRPSSACPLSLFF